MAPLSTETRREFSGVVRGGAPAENGFSVIQSSQIASYDSKFFTRVTKSGEYGNHSPKSGGTGTSGTLKITPMSENC